MDDGEFNLSNTIGIGLNIGEQMMLPVANGAEEAEFVLQQQQQLQRQHEQHLLEQQQQQEQQQQHQNQHHQQQIHYDSQMAMDQQAVTNVNNSPETTTNVTCLDNSIGNFYQENNDLEDLNAKLAETTKILDYTPAGADATGMLPNSLQEENAEKLIVEELGSIVKKSGSKENTGEDTLSTEGKEKDDNGNTEKGKGDEKAEAEKEPEAEREPEPVPEQEEAEAEGEETDGDEEVEEVGEEDEDEVEEEIIPDEVIVPENSQDAVKHIKPVKDTEAEEDDAAEDTNKDADENEDSQNNEEEEEEAEAEEPSSIARRTRRIEEQIDENQCRVCCAKENLVSIFKKMEERTVADLLMTICPSVSIVIKDFLPQYICNACCDNVATAIKLKNQCETTEKEFRKKLSRHKNKIRRPVGYVVIDAPLDSDPPTDEEPANDEEFKVSDIASATPSEDSESSDFSDSKRRKRSRKRRKSAVVTPTEGKRSKNKSKSDNQSSGDYEDDGDPIKQKRKRSTNSSPNNFNCIECGQSFTRKQSLVLHKRQHIYDRGDPIKCEVCGKKFKIKGAYRTHLEKHKEERRPNKCNQCSRRFTSRSDLKRHIAQNHREKDILPTCSKCHRTFSSAGRLQRHKQNGCGATDATKIKKPETSSSFVVGTDLFKAVAPLQSTYWSDSFSD